jgi:hypothetical protein
LAHCAALDFKNLTCKQSEQWIFINETLYLGILGNQIIHKRKIFNYKRQKIVFCSNFPLGKFFIDA